MAKKALSGAENGSDTAVIAALKKAAGFIRRELGHRIQLRYTPELIFELDTNIEYAARISQILRTSEGKAHGYGEQSEEN